MTEMDLLECEELAEREALALCSRLRLRERLAQIGDPVLVGAARLRVIDRADVDVTTVCTSLDRATASQVAQLGAGLALHEDVREVSIRDDTGQWNLDPNYPDGLYLGIHCRSPRGRDWTIDLWFVDEPNGQPDLAHIQRFAPHMTDEIRKTILTLKRDTRALVDEGEEPIAGYLIYEAVIEGGVRSLPHLRTWLTETHSV